jgi:hypothetical protein
MNAVRTTVSADMLSPIINLPWASKNLQVEVVVITLDERTTRRSEVSVENLEGCLQSYANPALWEKEHYAWENNIIEKYGNT